MLTVSTPTPIDFSDFSKFVPFWFHVSVTILCFCLFVVTLQQICRSQISNKSLLKNRLLVSGNALVLLIIAIMLNIYLTNSLNMPHWFTLMVTLWMIIWTCTTYLLAYLILLKAFTQTYKAKKGKELTGNSKLWILKAWKISVILYECVIILSTITALITEWFRLIKFVFLISYFEHIITSIIAMVSFYDIKYNVINKRNISDKVITNGKSVIDDMLKTKKYKIQRQRIKQIRRFKKTVNYIFCSLVFVIFLSFVYIMGLLADSENGKLISDLNYSAYMGINIIFGILLIQWTYTADTGFCPLFLCPNSKYDTDTVCYKYFCYRFVSLEDIKARRQISKDFNAVQLRMEPMDTVLTTNRVPEFPNSVITRTPSNLHKKEAINVRIFIYGFSGVITTQNESVFIKASLEDIKSLTKKQLLSFFESKRVEMIEKHLKKLGLNCKIYLNTNLELEKVSYILKTIGLLEYFTDETASGDSKHRILSNDKNVKQLVEDLVNFEAYKHNQIMIIENDIEILDDLSSCRTYHVKNFGLTAKDCRNIISMAN